MTIKETIAKLAYQYAKFIDDKDINQRWHELENKEFWFDFAENAISIIKPN